MLIEWFARRLRFDRLAAALPGNLYPPYLLVGVALFIEYGVFDVHNHFVTGKSTLITDPASLGIGVGFPLAVVALRKLELSRREAIKNLEKLDYNETASDTGGRVFTQIKAVFERFRPKRRQTQSDSRYVIFRKQSYPLSRSERPFTPTVLLQYKLIAYLLGIALSLFNTFEVIGYYNIIEIQGFFVGIIGLFLFPIVYIPLIVDVIVLCLGVSFVLPRQIVHADPDLFYHSPRQFGGLKCISKTLHQSYFLYIFGFASYAGVLYLQHHPMVPSKYPPPGTNLDLLFTGLGIAGAGVIGYSVYRIHTFMKRKRDQRLDELEAEVRRRVEAPIDTYGEATLGVDGWETLQTEIEQVRSTRTYPFTPAASLRIGIGVLLPQALNLLRLALTTDLSAVVGA